MIRILRPTTTMSTRICGARRPTGTQATRAQTLGAGSCGREFILPQHDRDG